MTNINATLKVDVSLNDVTPMSALPSDFQEDCPDIPPWQQAVTLMQPTFIRVMDHLRNALEQSDWAGQYETVHAWPEGTTPEEQAEVLWLYDKLESADDISKVDIELQLEDFPQPVPVYLLHLTKFNQTRTLNLWELCYQICLLDYTPQIERTTFVDIPLESVTPDYTLFDTAGEVDWSLLDKKTAQVIQAAFQALS